VGHDAETRSFRSWRVLMKCGVIFREGSIFGGEGVREIWKEKAGKKRPPGILREKYYSIVTTGYILKKGKSTSTKKGRGKRNSAEAPQAGGALS